MVMIGVFPFFQGLAAVIQESFYAVPNYAHKVDVTAWGWIHMLLGILVAVAGIYLFVGKLWERTIAIILALLSAVANIYVISYYPVWSILIIALDVIVISAVAWHGRNLQQPILT
jgi:hypothetical protein